MSSKQTEPKSKICLLRDIYRIVREYEAEFQQRHNLCLNETMLMCSLKFGQLSSSELADKLGLSTSNTSKVIKSTEEKGFIVRTLGKQDKRQMNFSLSKNGLNKLQEMEIEEPSMNRVLEAIYSTKNLEVNDIL